MPQSTAIENVSLVETSMFRQARLVALIGVNVAFVLVALVHLHPERTVTDSVFFGVLLVWAGFRLATRRSDVVFRIGDVGFVVVAGLLEPLIVSAQVADASMSATRALAYPAVVAVGVVEAKRWSFAAMIAITGASAVGDVLLFGAPHFSLLALALSWAAAVLVHRLIQRAAESTDAADALARQARMRERVATARVRFEREHFAMLHDTAASTLMMVRESPALDANRLAAQAARDVEVLTGQSGGADPDRAVDLVDETIAVCREANTHIVVHESGPVAVPALVASAASAATREALNNVDRHAQASAVIVRISKNRVTITDNGNGFDVAAQPRGFGLRYSIESRMRRAGGTGTVRSTLGHGTTVELTWPEVPPEPRAETLDSVRIMRGFKYGMAATAVLVGLEMLALGFEYGPGVESAVSWAIVVSVFVTGLVAAALVRGAPGFVRWLWMTALTGLALVHIAVVPAHQIDATQNWVSIAVGWGLVALLCSWVRTSNHVVIGCALIVGYWLVSGIARVVRTPASDIIEYAGFGLASVATMQVAALSCAWVLAEAVRVAEEVGEGLYAAATQRAVEEALQQDYRTRFARLTADIVELLGGIADGSMSVDQPAVQVRAEAEYARLRRLFVQAESFEHPLMQRLRPVLDSAGDRGVDVAFDIAARPPDLADADIEAVTTAVDGLVAGAERRVRLVVSTTNDQVTVSVVTDCSDDVREQVRHTLAHSDFQLTVDGSVTWLRVHVPVSVAA